MAVHAVSHMQTSSVVVQDVGAGSLSDSDVDKSDNDSEDERNDGKDEKTASGMADVLAKILNKQPAKSGSVILSKAKTDRQLFNQKIKKSLEESKCSDRSSKARNDERINQLNDATRLKKTAWEEMGRVKPEVTKKEKERNLQRIASRGVVQLFNAVKKQQKLVEEKLNEAGSSSKKSKVMKSMTKGAFLDILKSTNTVVDVGVKPKKNYNSERKIDLKDDDDKPAWSVLRDDFMMGAKMKDWDKVSDGDSDSDAGGDISVSDSDG